MLSRCLNVLRDPAGPAGEETAQSVQCQEGPQALAAPLHPGQQPLPGGHQEALPASDRRELSEWKPQPQCQGGEQKGGRNQGGGGHCQQLNMNVTLIKDWLQSLFLVLGNFYSRIICPPAVDVWNKCTYSSVPHVEMFTFPEIVCPLCALHVPLVVYTWGPQSPVGWESLCGTELPSEHTHYVSFSTRLCAYFGIALVCFNVSSCRLITCFPICYYHIVQIMQICGYPK